MLREPTIEKLHALRLRVLAGAWLEQDKSPDTLALSFDERLAMLVDLRIAFQVLGERQVAVSFFFRAASMAVFASSNVGHAPESMTCGDGIRFIVRHPRAASEMDAQET